MNARIQEYLENKAARVDEVIQSVEPASPEGRPEIVTIALDRKQFETIKSAMRLSIVETTRQTRSVLNTPRGRVVFAKRLNELKEQYDNLTTLLEMLEPKHEPHPADVSVVGENTMSPSPEATEDDEYDRAYEAHFGEKPSPDEVMPPEHVEFGPPSDGSPEA